MTLTVDYTGCPCTPDSVEVIVRREAEGRCRLGAALWKGSGSGVLEDLGVSEDETVSVTLLIHCGSKEPSGCARCYVDEEVVLQDAVVLVARQNPYPSGPCVPTAVQAARAARPCSGVEAGPAHDAGPRDDVREMRSPQDLPFPLDKGWPLDKRPADKAVVKDAAKPYVDAAAARGR